ncbi:MAG: hypothetical protein K6G33_05500 [Ruminococcus sp.]|uniref:Rnf-Nqr domain containing protein n=1 Tax=Ruminococcus sp. TaxID=41978 RepID=UPI0025E34356|nr:Rnf-Nqr domain containing protein [Ruminococcus sp.]MCR5600180.1 hypothetical protein [Ruminococcus sp.]
MFLINELITLLVANLILSQALGISTIFIAAGSKKNLIGTACVITLFTTVGSAAAYAVDSMLPYDMKDLRLLLYTLVTGAMYVLLLTAAYLLCRGKYTDFRKYIHVSAFNCAVMGTLFTINERAVMDSSLFTLSEYVSAGFEAGIGFIIAALILTAAYRKLNLSKVPASFRGFPAMLVYLGIISMAVYSLK